MGRSLGTILLQLLSYHVNSPLQRYSWWNANHFLLSFLWNSIRTGGPADGIVTETVHKTLPGGGRDQGGRGSGF